MKNFFTLTLLLALLLPTTASAYDFELDGIYYYIEGTNAIVTRSVDVETNGAVTYSYYSGDVIIPLLITHGGVAYTVTGISDGAFSNSKELTSVTIPSTVTTIGEGAFWGCTGLTSIWIPKSVTQIGPRVFGCCSGLTSITVSSSNKNYDSRDNCNAIIETESNTMVAGCQNTTIPNSVTSIADEAFNGHINLTNITIPNSVTTVGNYAFSGCSGLTNVTIPNSVTTIGRGAFYQCVSLAGITISSSVTSIGEYAFQMCHSLASIAVESGNTVYDSRDNCNALIETASNQLLVGCQNTVIPNSVTSIARQAFYMRSGRFSINIPNSVTVIGDIAFDGCTGLESVTLGNSVTTIGDYAFRDCALTSIIFPKSVTSIGTNVISGCSGMESIAVESGNPVYDSRDNCNAVIETASNRLLMGCQNTVIPNSVTSIGDYAFYDCTRLKSITIPNSVTVIGNYAFWKCFALENVSIGNAVNTIGIDAFAFCTSLTSLIIPSSVTRIYNDSFVGCEALESISVESGNTIYDSRNHCNAIIVTANNILMLGCQNTVIPNTVTSIGHGAFSCNSNLTSITIPNSVTELGNYAFNGCTGLTSITLPNSVTSIGQWVFSGCTNLASITIPNSVKRIGEAAFCTGGNLTDVYSYVYDPSKVAIVFVFYESGIFDSLNDSSPVRTLHVPYGRAMVYGDEYNGWSPFFTNIVEMDFDGDANLDGVFNVADVCDVVDYILGSEGVQINEAGADMNGNGAVDMGDLVDLIDRLLSNR